MDVDGRGAFRALAGLSQCQVASGIRACLREGHNLKLIGGTLGKRGGATRIVTHLR